MKNIISKENSEAIIRCYNKGIILKRYGFEKCMVICSYLMKGENVPENMFGVFTQKFNNSLNDDEKNSITKLASKYKGQNSDLLVEEVFGKFFQQDEDFTFRTIGKIFG